MDEKTKELILDLLTKLKNPFSKDMYIVHNKYVCGGKESIKKNLGLFIGIIEKKYVEALNEFLDKEKIYFISSMKDLKSIFPDGFNVVDEISEEIEKALGVVDDCNQDLVWKPMSDIKDLAKVLLEDKKNYVLKLDQNEITIGKSMLPMFSTKNVDLWYYNSTIDEELDLLDFRIDFRFTHFQLLLKYHALNI